LQYNEPLTVKELHHAIANAKDGSPGPDKITFMMIKNLHQSMKELILSAFNRIYSEQTFPKSWTTAIVIPIAKQGKDPHNPLNCRPISLTNCLCKIMEKMVNCRLMWVKERDGHISSVQSGFRKNRSTTDNLVQFETLCAASYIPSSPHSCGLL
jgi:potassium voltage-gated channel Eag-related subfamily H protein 8